MKKFIIFVILFGIFLGCQDEQILENTDTNDTVPLDVPIATPDANISIDENMPPEPVVGG